jgi:isopenicillin N synthase-like dioxygenase
MSLPIISIAPWLRTDSDIAARTATSKALHEACLEFGFFYLDLSEFVDPAVPEELTTLARQFFALPQEEKDKISLSHQDYARGTFSASNTRLTHLVMDTLHDRISAT